MFKVTEGQILPEPLRTSSLIRVARWSFLALGFSYGVYRFNVLQRRENKLREVRLKEKPAKDAAKAALKARLYKEQEAELMVGETAKW